MNVNLSTLPIVLAIAIIFSILTLYVIESWIKFILFGFEILVIMICFLFLTWEESSSFRKYQMMRLFNLGTKLYKASFSSLVLIGVSSILIVLILFNTEGGTFQLFLAMISGSFLVGYSILTTLRIGKYFTTIEFCIVSFLTSISFTGFFFFLLSYSGDDAEIIMTISFLIIGVASLLVTSRVEDRKDGKSRPTSLTRRVDALVIGVCLGFYLIFSALVYPEAASIVGTDISRHFGHSAVLLRTPELYSGSHYLLFHSFQGSIFLLSGENQPIFPFLTSFVFLNIFVPLSIYAGSKRLLEETNKRIPGLAVIFYTFFSNLSFLYFMALYIVRPEQRGEEYLLIIREVAEKSYFSIINFLQPFNFVGPLTISIIVVLVLLSLMRNGSIPKYRYIGLISFLVATGGLIHVPEIAIFASLISLYSILGGRFFPRISETLIAISIGLSVSAIIFLAIDIIVLKDDSVAFPSVLGAFLLPAGISTIAFILKHRRVDSHFIRPTIHRFLKSLPSSTIEGSIIAIVIVYLIGITLWFFVEELKTSNIYQDIGAIPSFLYPMMLGIVGLLAIFSIRDIRNQTSTGAIAFLLLGILFFLVIGKVVSFININFFDLPYWEKRLPGLIFIFASMLAPVTVINLFARVFEKRRNKILSTLFLASVLASITLLGFTSMAISIEYWHIRAKGEQKLGMQELDAVATLKRVIDQQDSSVTISPSDYSRHVTTFAAPTYQFSKPDVLFSSKTPAVPLMILGGLPYDRIYVYIHERDLDILDANPSSWFSKHLLPSLPLVYGNEEVKIYNATGLKSPLPSSENAVITPSDRISDNWVYPYNAVSKSSMNYTEIIDQDTSSFTKFSNMVLTYDPISSFDYYLDLTSKNVSQDFWRSIGEWQQGTEGLRGFGNYSDSSANRNMLISDFISESNNMTLSTLFKINSDVLNTKDVTLVTFAYSWINQTNFDVAGVALKDRQVYVQFATIRDSKMTLYPQFPYTSNSYTPLFTGLDWKGGSVFNMTLSKSGDMEDLYINGTKYLSRTNSNRSSGFIGISTSGTNDIVFKQLAISIEMDSPRSYNDYHRYVSSGGNLTVYNTNGYGSIFELLNMSKSPLTKVSMTYPHNLTVTKAKLGLGNIFYIDIYSLLKNESISENEKNSLLEDVVSTILKADFDPVDRNFREIPLFFENMKAEGDIHINTSFVGLPGGIDGRLVALQTSDNRDQPPLGTNISSLNLYGYDAATIHSDSLAFLRKGGIYSNVILNKDQTISLAFDRNASIKLGASNGSQFDYENVTFIALEINQPWEVVTRTPVINIVGNIQFVNLHAARLAGIDGDDVAFNGRITFEIPASDAYTLTQNVSYDGTFSTPSISYDEFSMFISSFYLLGLESQQQTMIVVLAIPYILSAIFLVYRRT